MYDYENGAAPLQIKDSSGQLLKFALLAFLFNAFGGGCQY